MTEAVRAHLFTWARAWGPAALWLAVLFVLSHQPGDAVPSWWAVPDPVAHLLLYTVLGATLAWAQRCLDGRPGPIVLFALGLLLAVFDEWHQSHVPGRTPSASDVAADAVGLLMGGVAATLAFRHLVPRPDGPGRNR